jgi:dolichol-phosphate mannosyltransferase
MYEGFQETWREWGRSLDLKDASSVAQLWGDVALLILVQGLPLFLLGILSISLFLGYDFLMIKLAIALNIVLLLTRFALLFAVYPSYYRPKTSIKSLFFFLSPLADPLAVLRIVLSATQKPKQWRGRAY